MTSVRWWCKKVLVETMARGLSCAHRASFSLVGVAFRVTPCRTISTSMMDQAGLQSRSRA
jgi:hypothetical protein